MYKRASPRALGRQPDRTIMVQLGELRDFSDIAGRHAIRLVGIAERRKIAARLQTAGCDVDLSGDDWQTAGDLAPPPPPTVRRPDPAAVTEPEPSGPEIRVTARYERRGSGSGLLTLSNEGSVDLHDVRFELPDEAGTSLFIAAELPIAVLPIGGEAGFLTSRTMGAGADQFELPITARTPDGTSVATTAYVNLVV